MTDLQQDLRSLDDEAIQNQLAVVRWSQIHHPELPFRVLRVHGYSHANLVLPDQQAHHRKEIPEIHESSLVVHMDLQWEIENGENPRNVENSCDEAVIDKLQLEDFEAENSEKQPVGFPKVESERMATE